MRFLLPKSLPVWEVRTMDWDMDAFMPITVWFVFVSDLKWVLAYIGNCTLKNEMQQLYVDKNNSLVNVHIFSTGTRFGTWASKNKIVAIKPSYTPLNGNIARFPMLLVCLEMVLVCTYCSLMMWVTGWTQNISYTTLISGICLNSVVLKRNTANINFWRKKKLRKNNKEVQHLYILRWTP
jgi:hypothetical protein